MTDRHTTHSGRSELPLGTSPCSLQDGAGGVTTQVCVLAVVPHDQNNPSLDDVTAQAAAAVAAVDGNGQINPVDSGIIQSLFGTCEEPRAVCP